MSLFQFLDGLLVVKSTSEVSGVDILLVSFHDMT